MEEGTFSTRKLKREGSFVSIKLFGHLMDTKCINKVIDLITETYGFKVNLNNWIIGNGKDFKEKSEVMVNIFTQPGDGDVFKCLNEVGDICKSMDCEVLDE